MLSLPVPRYIEVGFAYFGIELLGFLLMNVAGRLGFAVIAISATLGTITMLQGLWSSVRGHEHQSNQIHPNRD